MTAVPQTAFPQTADAKTAADQIKTVVRDRYGAIASGGGKGCGASRCGEGELDMIGGAYAGLEGYVADADLGLGCGLPTRHAGIEAGEVVLDLGAGAGIDAFVARRLVGERGRVIGVDMTAAMVERARANAEKLGFANVDFRLGEIEALPVADATVDLVISNCVLNLVPDKAAAFAQTFRVLKPGGRFCISDIVATGPLPDGIRKAAALYVGCVAGAWPEADYLAVIRAAGFADVRIVERKPIPLPDTVLAEHLPAAERQSFRASGIELLSVTVLGTRPTSGACCSPGCCS
jgi:arsenite methyltransferase